MADADYYLRRFFTRLFVLQVSQSSHGRRTESEALKPRNPEALKPEIHKFRNS